MPKRRCPFDSDLCPQEKVHVGEKEVNFGVQIQNNMKNVYAKTLQKLFQGARTAGQESNRCSHVAVNSSGDLQDHRNNSFVQLHLGNRCQLTREEQPIHRVTQEIINGDLSLPHNKCSYCECPVCRRCQIKCHRCIQIFCHQCCISVFSGRDDANLCLSCLP